MKSLVIDLNKCTGCYNCQITCKDEHVGNDWTPYTKPQSEGQFWMKVKETERGSIPKLKIEWIPILCMHCEKAPCIAACQDIRAIHKRADGLVMIDQAKCNGCQKCLQACPYGAIYFNADLKVAQKCTMCAHLLDQGWAKPRCVSACPTEAMSYGESEELKPLIERGEILPLENNPGAIKKAQVYYIGLSKRFIAGEVYCPREDKCLEGVELTLTNLTSGEKRVAKTNNYGDFWLEKLEVGVYQLALEKEGYYPKEIKAIDTKEDVNSGGDKAI